MYILLKDTDNLKDEGFYIKTEVYDREIEKILIELYYRGVAEGLVEYSEEIKSNEDLEEVSLVDWVTGKDKSLKSVREKRLLEELGSRILI